MIKARRLEDWLADWLEKNSEGKVLRNEGTAALFDDEIGQIIDVTRLAEDLAVALAEESADRA